MDFEWDPTKASQNLQKHRVDFSEADVKGKLMRKSSATRRDELRPEYDAALIRKGVRGKYAAEYRRGTNLVLLEPDVATAFPTTESVNEALRLLMKVAGSVSKAASK